jgi:hypothetical protein
VIHGNAIAYGNGIKFKGNTTPTTYPLFNCLSDISQMHMAGDNLGEAIDNSDKRLINFRTRQAYSTQQRPMWRPLHPPLNHIAFHAFAPSVLIIKNRPSGTE